MFYIFRTKIYKDQMFYNDLCHRYFIEGYITNFILDDIKAGCRILLCQAYHREKKDIVSDDEYV